MSMSKRIIALVLLTYQLSWAQSEVFQDGEWFKFKMSYSGWLKAGDATL